MEQIEKGTIPKREVASIGSRSIGKIINTEFGLYYIDIAKNPFMRNQRVFLFIDKEGKIDVVLEGGIWKNKYMIKAETEGMPPSQNLWEFNVFSDTPTMKLDEAFNLAKEVLEQTVVFKDKRMYDLVTSWCMYTWLRGLFPKNINLYFIGFPATGKSQALKYCKHFARYVVDYDPTAEKSYKWNISHTLGVIAIDEAEYISKVQASKLRKYHEANVVETRLIGLPMVGLTPIDLRVDAPLVLSATHPPSDTAFLQRGYIIRMQKGTPEIKDFDLIPDLDYRKFAFAKSVLCNWSRIFETLNKVFYQLSFKNMDERIKDLVVPIAAILESVGKEWDWVIEYAKYSFSQANFITPETTAFIQTLSIVRDESLKLNDKYVLPISKFSEIMDKVGRVLGANPNKLDYLRQYLFAGCEIGLHEGELVYICDKETVNSILENLNIVNIDEVSNGDLDIFKYISTSPKLLKVILEAIGKYIFEKNLDYKSGVVTVSLSHLRKFFPDKNYRKLGKREMLEKFRKMFVDGGTPRILKEHGLDFKVEDGEGYVVLDLDRIRNILTAIEKIPRRG